MRKCLLFAVVGLVLLVGLTTTPRVHAAGLVIPCDTVVDGQFTNPCGIDTFVKQFIVLSNYGLTIVAVLAVLMFLYGGFQFITAAGRASKIDEGKRVIIGTLVGLMISFGAFVIVNFSIAALTGSAVARSNINPFGAIAKVFAGQNGLERQFNTTGQTSTSSDCHSLTSGWDKGCDPLQIHCSDPSTNSGPIQDLQKKLNQLSCGQNTLATDGCYGPLTMSAVRRFQVANDLAPTGQIDTATQTKLNGLPSAPIACNATTAIASLVDGVTGVLPATQDSGASSSTSGCCVVKKGAVSLYCADQVTERTCDANNGTFYAGVISCANDTQTKDTCGYCFNPNGGCFQTATNFWCTQVVQPAMSFQPGLTCLGAQPNNQCSASCTTELLNIAP